MFTTNRGAVLACIALGTRYTKYMDNNVCMEVSDEKIDIIN